MIASQKEKSVVLIAGATVATNATNSVYVDRLGYNYATFDLILPKATATNSDAKWGVVSLLQGDSTTVGSCTAVAAFTGTTEATATSGFVIAAHNDTSVGQVTRLHYDCRTAGRYLHIRTQAPAAMSTVSVIARLSRGREEPNTAAEAGSGAVVYG